MLRFGTILTFLTVLFFPTIATAESVSHPTIRGDYYLCPNGKTISKYYWTQIVKDNFDPTDLGFWNGDWDTNTLDEKGNISKISSMRSKLIIGKKAGDYDYEIIKRLKEKMLYQGIKTTNAYIANSIGPIYDDYGSIRKWQYSFKNSEGKTLTIERRFGSGAKVTNYNGTNFAAKIGFNPIAFLYCTPDSINLRVVKDIRLEDIKNQYGELVKLPMMFWMVDIGIKSDLPKSQNEIDF